MGVFWQYAIFPGCDEVAAWAAVKAASEAGFHINLPKCRCGKSYEGAQVLMEGNELGFAPLARALSDAALNPAMLLYIYDGGFWGYDFYGGQEEAHFSTLPDYFGPVTQEEKGRLSGSPESLVDCSLLRDLPSALSPGYIRRLLEEDGVREFCFEHKTPRDVMDAVNAHRWTVNRPERDPLCQRLSVLAALCAYWLNEGSVWGFLDHATYEPLYGSADKPADIDVLRTRASLTGFTKRHRAIKDLERLMELDPGRRELYQEEIRRWERQELERYLRSRRTLG